MHEHQGIEVRALACGGEHSLAASEAGELYTWGWGRYGNLGLGRAEDRLIPVKVGSWAMHPNPTPLMRPARSRTACIARGPCAALSCVSPAQGVKVVSMSCGAEHSVGLSDSGVLYAWGWGSYGNLGDGERVDRWAPVKVRLPIKLQALAHALLTWPPAASVIITHCSPHACAYALYFSGNTLS